jgi:hypothetical protein
MSDRRKCVNCQVPIEGLAVNATACVPCNRVPRIHPRCLECGGELSMCDVDRHPLCIPIEVLSA